MFVANRLGIVYQFFENTFALEVLHNPSMSTLGQCLRNALGSPTGSVHIVYAGAVFSETGSWILSDSCFSAYNFYELVESESETRSVGWGWPPFELDPNSGAIEQRRCSIPQPKMLVKDGGNAEIPCRGHRSIAEHLAKHKIEVHFHTQPVGEWLVLATIFANHQLDLADNQFAKSKTSSFILEDLAKRVVRSESKARASAAR